ncbi:MAG: hypothetical protein ACLQT7_04660 [Candidatus Dormibacteria bacterium]
MPIPTEDRPARSRELPPAWGMDGERRPGSGSPRRVGFAVSRLDAVLVVAGLLIWTAVFLVFFAPR